MRRRINVRNFSRKQKIGTVLGAGAISLAGAGAAFAFWTSGGSGDGTATTAAGDANSLTVNQTAAPTNLAPGVAAGAINATVTNGGTTKTQVNQVVVSIQSVAKAVGAPAGTCDATDYTLSGATMTNGAGEVNPSATSGTFSGATLAFNNKATNQDACKGATVNLHYVAS
jgi:hypothetical protein